MTLNAYKSDPSIIKQVYMITLNGNDITQDCYEASEEGYYVMVYIIDEKTKKYEKIKDNKGNVIKLTQKLFGDVKIYLRGD